MRAIYLAMISRRIFRHDQCEGGNGACDGDTYQQVRCEDEKPRSLGRELKGSLVRCRSWRASMLTTSSASSTALRKVGLASG